MDNKLEQNQDQEQEHAAAVVIPAQDEAMTADTYTMAATPSDEGLKIKDIVLKILDENKGTDIACSDANVVNYCEWIVVCTCRNPRHVKALTDFLCEGLKKSSLCQIINTEGTDYNRWVVVDTIWVVVHLQLENLRAIYDLESQWFIPKEE